MLHRDRADATPFAETTRPFTGRLAHSQWTDADTGQPRERYEVVATFIGYLDPPKASSEPADAGEQKPGHEPF